MVLRPTYLDSVLAKALEGNESPTAQDYLKTIMEDEKVIAAVNEAIKTNGESPDGLVGSSPIQRIRQAVVDVIN